MKNYFCYSGFGLRAALVAVGTLLLAACAPGQDSPTPAANIDVSRYVAVGDTYTAGVSAGGLTRASQRYSFPIGSTVMLSLVASLIYWMLR